MFKRFVLLPFFLLWTVCLISCSSANNKPVLIQFSRDSSSLIISGIAPAGLLQIRNTPHIDTAYAHLVTILQISAGEAQPGGEVPVEGKIKVTKNALVFTPLKPFVPGKRYLVITYMNSQFGNAGMLIKGKLSYSVKPQQEILER